jgi:hypothetical protein
MMATKLSPAARTLRRRLLSQYDFGADAAALTLLDQLVLAVCQLHDLQARLSADGLVVTGSVGQPVAHPLLAEQDRLRRSVMALTRALRLSLDEVA